MRMLNRGEDPSGFLTLFRLAASDRFGDPSGNIQGRGLWHHGRKKGPGRYNAGPRCSCTNGAKGLNNRVLRRGR